MDAEKYKAFKAQLAGGGAKVVVADQLFETPKDLAERMVDMVEIVGCMDVLEPSAGTGVIVEAIRQQGGRAVSVEINGELAKSLEKKGGIVINGDFLQCGEELGTYDAVVMNPPFSNAQDIAHIMHAFKFLKAGGRLAAICANGPRQKEKLGAFIEQHGGTWEDLPAGTFKDKGTSVNTALIFVQKEAA